MARYKHPGSVIETTHRPMAHAALAQALTLSRRGRSAPIKDQRHGDRIDTRRLARVATADLRVFVKRGAPAPDKIRVSILLDASGSMGSWLSSGQSCAQACCQIARDLAGATRLLPWVTADISAFTTGGGDVTVFPLWQSGQDESSIDSYGSIRMGGTEEGYALAFARDELMDRRKPREQALIIIVSDGAPSEPAHVKAVVEQCRRDRIPVVSVALEQSAAQPLMYGRENVVMFDGNIRALARNMARAIGRVL